MLKIDEKTLETYLKYTLGFAIVIPLHYTSHLNDTDFLIIAICLGLSAGLLCAFVTRNFLTAAIK